MPREKAVTERETTMGMTAQLNAVYENMTAGGMESTLTQLFNRYYFSNAREEVWNDLPMHVRAAIFGEWLSASTAEGEVARDLFLLLGEHFDEETRDAFVKRLLEDNKN